MFLTEHFISIGLAFGAPPDQTNNLAGVGGCHNSCHSRKYQSQLSWSEVQMQQKWETNYCMDMEGGWFEGKGNVAGGLSTLQSMFMNIIIVCY